jgi:hypothetical protein
MPLGVEHNAFVELIQQSYSSAETFDTVRR